MSLSGKANNSANLNLNLKIPYHVLSWGKSTLLGQNRTKTGGYSAGIHIFSFIWI
jgi:hypothetical protein